VLLISAGAAGGEYALDVVAQVLQVRQPCQAVIVCGRNEELRKEVAALVHAAPAPRRDHFHVLGYTDDMAALMQAANLFVGKPGGLTSSECMAVGLPMVLVNPIPGQEVRNSDFLLEEGAAVRCNYRTTIGYKIDALLGEPGRLERMAANAQRIGRPLAAQVIAETALHGDARHFWLSHAAQKALADYAERGVAVVSAEEPRRERAELEKLDTLYDSTTGRSVGMVTAEEFAALRRRMGSQMQGQTLAVNEATLQALRKQSVDTGVVAFFGQMLGDAAETIVRLPASLLPA
jgi:processive 1,2-diacylglycerol beta-glucosyltransferase